MKIWSWLLVGVMAMASVQDADAGRRLGGGGSVGRQSSNVTQRQAAPQQPTAPSQAAQPAKPAQPQPAAPAPSRPWAGILGGLAAGLGLAWLAHSLGLGAGFGNVLMLLLLAGVAFAVITAIMRRRATPQPAGFPHAGTPAPEDVAAAPRQYNPEKVGNDASARPWERNSMAFEPAKVAQGGSGLRIGSALEGSQSWGIPAGFDTEGFVAAAKRNFVTLQDAWDRGDLNTLRSMMTDEMLAEIRNQLAERDRQPGAQAGRTEVVMLEAKLLGIEETAADYLASVEFSGMLREDVSAGPAPFREVWNMAKPRAGAAGWLVAGVQALQ